MSTKIKQSGNYNFKPSIFIRNRHLQSVLASSRVLVPGKNQLEDGSQTKIIITAVCSRLLSLISPHVNPRGLIILIHGWEGSSSSAYILSAGKYFYNLGFSVGRLNLRDHGNSHHLNDDYDNNNNTRTWNIYNKLNTINYEFVKVRLNWWNKYVRQYIQQ